MLLCCLLQGSETQKRSFQELMKAHMGEEGSGKQTIGIKGIGQDRNSGNLTKLEIRIILRMIIREGDGELVTLYNVSSCQASL